MFHSKVSDVAASQHVADLTRRIGLAIKCSNIAFWRSFSRNAASPGGLFTKANHCRLLWTGLTAGCSFSSSETSQLKFVARSAPVGVRCICASPPGNMQEDVEECKLCGVKGGAGGRWKSVPIMNSSIRISPVLSTAGPQHASAGSFLCGCAPAMQASAASTVSPWSSTEEQWYSDIRQMHWTPAPPAMQGAHR
eukprot:CAMPEP_0172752534 /NCGR_PEP_ID=MMETSP1074-20121228/154000_1 /TAXON_ID=2916 /ORGANISM="Ceratium fusus, Strain PA161109" /LENGTH=193 /DNA_ID=CAMNT_0013585045 /DNA_START=95 /DNA_END=676 /DNA_ORIENTATION=+